MRVIPFSANFRVRSWCKNYFQWRQIYFLFFHSLSLSPSLFSLQVLLCLSCSFSNQTLLWSGHRHSDLNFPGFLTNWPPGKFSQYEALLKDWRAKGKVRPGHASLLLGLFQQWWPLHMTPVPSVHLFPLGSQLIQAPQFSFLSYLWLRFQALIK